MKLTYRTAHLDDLEYLAPRLRPEDIREVQTATGRPVLDVLDSSWVLSDEIYVALMEGQDKPFAVFGVARPGVIWMLSTPDILKCGIAATKLARQFIKAWLREYPMLFNLVDSRNTVHVKWLEMLGAKLLHSRPLNGVSFHYFEIHRKGGQHVRASNDHRGIRSAP